MPQLALPVRRLHLGNLDETYSGLWIDVRRSLRTKEQMAVQKATAVVMRELRAVQAAQSADAAAGDDAPAQVSEAFFDAQHTILSVYSVASNIDADQDGNPLPPPTDPAFWAAMPAELKEHLTAHIGSGNAARNEARAADNGAPAPTPPTPIRPVDPAPAASDVAAVLAGE